MEPIQETYSIVNGGIVENPDRAGTETLTGNLIQNGKVLG